MLPRPPGEEEEACHGTQPSLTSQHSDREGGGGGGVQ